MSASSQRFERPDAAATGDAELLEYRPSQKDARGPRGNLPAIDIARRKDRGK